MLKPSDVRIKPDNSAHLAEIEAHVDKHLRLGVFPCDVPTIRAAWSAESEKTVANRYRVAGWDVIQNPTPAVMLRVFHPDKPTGNRDPRD